MAMHGQRPFIAAVLNGHPATLLIDTASTSTVVDVDTADDGPAAGFVSLQISDLRFPRLAVVRANVKSYTRTHVGFAADGVIGQDLLARYPVALDFPNRTLTIYRDGRSAASAQTSGNTSIALRVIDGQPAVRALLDGQLQLWFALGTGAGSEMRLDASSDHASRYSRIEPSLPYSEATLYGNSTGKLVRARTLVLGKLTFNQPLVALLGTRPGHPQSELSGVLGATMLSRLNVLIDESGAVVWVAAPPGATLAPLYDPSGVSVVMRRDAIVIGAVVPGTRADAAHLRPGDEIVSINGLAPATLDFARQLLDGSPGTKVTIVYRRWHIAHSVTLTRRVVI